MFCLLKNRNLHFHSQGFLIIAIPSSGVSVFLWDYVAVGVCNLVSLNNPNTFWAYGRPKDIGGLSKQTEHFPLPSKGNKGFF